MSTDTQAWVVDSNDYDSRWPVSAPDYLIEEAGDAEIMMRRVQRRMAKGYRPLGGLSVACWGTDGEGTPLLRYMQAMVKDKDV